MMEDSAMAAEGKRPFSPTFWQKHGSKLVALTFWLLLVGGYYLYTRQNGLTFSDSINAVVGVLTNALTGPIFYIILYALRPLIFFPATILTLLGGFLFGPLGILYTVIGSNASAMVAYGVGRYFGADVLQGDDSSGVVQRYAQRLRQNSFETVLIMRLLFLPYDLVNYLAGFLQISWRAFLLATAVGSIPGTISIVLLGASFGTVDELLAGNIQLNPWALGASVALIVVSLALSRLVKKREGRGN